MRPFSHFQPILQLDDLWPWYMTFDCMNIWRFTYYINKPSLVQTGHQLFKWGHFHISAYLTTWPQMILKWGFPCCTYNPTLIEIHQSMWKIEPNFNPFSQQTTTTDNNYSGQSDPYVSFLLRQATQKIIQTDRKKLEQKANSICVCELDFSGEAFLLFFIL